MIIRAFIADDHAIVREGLAALLATQADIEVVGTAANGRDALEQITRLAPHVAILDISMPELDGVEVTRQLMKAQQDLNIIVLSMHSSAQYVFHALEAGARGYLLKESAGKEIVTAVRTVQLGRRYFSPRVAAIMADGLGSHTATNPLESLSNREREILKLVADGYSSVKIGAMLHLSPKTVDSYRSRLMQKLHISDLVGLIKFAIQNGITDLE